MRILALTALAVVGSSAAVAADLYLADKGYRIPDSLPLIGGMTVEPGLMMAGGLMLASAVVPGLAPLALPMAVGATAFEGAKIASQTIIPHPVLPEGDGGGVAGGGAFGLGGNPRTRQFGIGPRDVTDADIDLALGRMAA